MRAQPSASHFIDGKPFEDTSGPILESRHPASGEVIARLHGATDAVIEAATESAARAQAAWAARPPEERGAVLRRAAAILTERNRALSELETLDTGKPLQETLVADAASGAECLDYMGRVVAGYAGRHIDLGGPHAYTRPEPFGVTLGIGAWNYPIQIACWKSAPALAMGNAMIFKPSEVTPLSALKLAEIYVEAGLPAGLFNVVQGFGDVAARLVEHPVIAKVSLTGSVPTGKKVLAKAGSLMKPATMELGGKSPLIVFEDADLESAIGGAMLGNFYSSGQVCSNGTRVFVHEAIHDRFVERLVERTRAIRIGDPMDEATQMGPLVSAAQLAKVTGYIEAGKAEGANLACGGDRPHLQGLEAGHYVEPTVFTGVTDSMTIAREEIFGPVMAVLSFRDEEEVIARANATPFGLAAGVFSADMERARRVVHRLQAGTCWINAYNLTPADMPFGGVKQSGMGRENGLEALAAWSQIKSVYVADGPVDSPY